MVKTFRDLLIWQKSMDYAEFIYAITEDFDASEKYGLKSQLRRSSVSISSNIAEGFGRFSNQEFIRFLNIALASLYENQSQIELCKRIQKINKKDFVDLHKLAREIERMISAFIKSLKQKLKY
jgi:four helix bundle protein